MLCPKNKSQIGSSLKAGYLGRGQRVREKLHRASSGESKHLSCAISLKGGNFLQSESLSWRDRTGWLTRKVLLGRVLARLSCRCLTSEPSASAASCMYEEPSLLPGNPGEDTGLPPCAHGQQTEVRSVGVAATLWPRAAGVTHR